MRWKTTNGHVVLMGVAQSWPEFRVAVAKVKAVDGVKSVKTYLRVVPPKKEPPAPSQRPS
jgi:osmotically-inducible protein OsmY